MQTVDSAGNTFVDHPNGQRTHFVEDELHETEHDAQKPKETVLIQHGFCRNTAHWQHWIPALARRFRVIRRDLRGHGLSSYPLQSDGYDYSLDTILLEMIQTLDALGIDKVHFIGESTSGMLGEVFAARHPKRLLSLTVISSPTHLPQPALELFAFGYPSWPEACRTLGSRGWAEALSKVPGTITNPDPAYIESWIDMVAVSSGEGLAGYAEFLSTLDSRPYLKDIHVPMLILAPANSAATKLPEQRALAEGIPNSRLEVINGRGHEVYVEMAEECQRLLFDFVDGLGEPEPSKQQ